uniref:Putative secreted protein n=1 Tax=Anopheles darlingi TaxID=43151 RepID=A0A2M4DP97_ANODA
MTSSMIETIWAIRKMTMGTKMVMIMLNGWILAMNWMDRWTAMTTTTMHISMNSRPPMGWWFLEERLSLANLFLHHRTEIQ